MSDLNKRLELDRRRRRRENPMIGSLYLHEIQSYRRWVREMEELDKREAEIRRTRAERDEFRRLERRLAFLILPISA